MLSGAISRYFPGDYWIIAFELILFSYLYYQIHLVMSSNVFWVYNWHFFRSRSFWVEKFVVAHGSDFEILLHKWIFISYQGRTCPTLLSGITFTMPYFIAPLRRDVSSIWRLDFDWGWLIFPGEVFIYGLYGRYKFKHVYAHQYVNTEFN